MRVALAVDGKNVTEHFGHCEKFVVFTIENQTIVNQEDIQNPPHQKGLLPKFLKEHNIDVVLVGNMGQMAVELIKQLGIEALRGVSGSIEDVIKSYLEGTLETVDKQCNHQHGEGHNC